MSVATLEQKVNAERRMRELIESQGLPEPSRIEYGFTCIRLFWEESKVCLVIDIDEPPEGFEQIGEQLSAIEEVTDWLGSD